MYFFYNEASENRVEVRKPTVGRIFLRYFWGAVFAVSVKSRCDSIEMAMRFH